MSEIARCTHVKAHGERCRHPGSHRLESGEVLCGIHHALREGSGRDNSKKHGRPKKRSDSVIIEEHLSKIFEKEFEKISNPQPKEMSRLAQKQIERDMQAVEATKERLRNFLIDTLERLDQV